MMIQFARSLSLPDKTRFEITISCQLCGEKLLSYFEMETFILSQLNFSHATGTDLLDNPVVRHHYAFGQNDVGTVVIIIKF